MVVRVDADLVVGGQRAHILAYVTFLLSPAARGENMDFEVTYTEEQQRFRREVRAWLEANVPASMQRAPVSAEDNYQRYLELRALGRKLGAKGWLYATAPAKYGGGGLDRDHAVILEGEGGQVDPSLPPYYDNRGRPRPAARPVLG